MEELREDWLVREQYRVARVAKLPYAHNPSRCAHYLTRYDRDADWDGVEGRRFFESLMADQFVTCDYHQLADWKVVADASVRLFRAHKDELVSEMRRALHKLPLAAKESHHLEWLFVDPIVWGGQASTLVNGQHRLCAIRASGASLCVIDHNRFDPYVRT